MAKWNIKITKFSNQKVKLVIIGFVLGFLISFLFSWQTIVHILNIIK